jgi:hypothetical protein
MGRPLRRWFRAVESEPDPGYAAPLAMRRSYHQLTQRSKQRCAAPAAANGFGVLTTRRCVGCATCGDTRLSFRFSVQHVARRGCGAVKRAFGVCGRTIPPCTKRWFTGWHCPQEKVKDVARSQSRLPQGPPPAHVSKGYRRTRFCRFQAWRGGGTKSPDKGRGTPTCASEAAARHALGVDDALNYLSRNMGGRKRTARTTCSRRGGASLCNVTEFEV